MYTKAQIKNATVAGNYTSYQSQWESYKNNNTADWGTPGKNSGQMSKPLSLKSTVNAGAFSGSQTTAKSKIALLINLDCAFEAFYQNVNNKSGMGDHSGWFGWYQDQMTVSITPPAGYSIDESIVSPTNENTSHEINNTAGWSASAGLGKGGVSGGVSYSSQTSVTTKNHDFNITKSENGNIAGWTVAQNTMYKWGQENNLVTDSPSSYDNNPNNMIRFHDPSFNSNYWSVNSPPPIGQTDFNLGFIAGFTSIKPIDLASAPINPEMNVTITQRLQYFLTHNFLGAQHYGYYTLEATMNFTVGFNLGVFGGNITQPSYISNPTFDINLFPGSGGDANSISPNTIHYPPNNAQFPQNGNPQITPSSTVRYSPNFDLSKTWINIGYETTTSTKSSSGTGNGIFNVAFSNASGMACNVYLFDENGNPGKPVLSNLGVNENNGVVGKIGDIYKIESVSGQLLGQYIITGPLPNWNTPGYSGTNILVQPISVGNN